MLASERDYEGGLLTSLLYGKLSDWLEQARTRDVWDGVAGLRVRSRCFTGEELAEIFTRNGLSIISHVGISAFSLLLSYLRGREHLTSQDEARMDRCDVVMLSSPIKLSSIRAMSADNRDALGVGNLRLNVTVAQGSDSDAWARFVLDSNGGTLHHDRA